MGRKQGVAQYPGIRDLKSLIRYWGRCPPSLKKAERRKLLDGLCLYKDLLEYLHYMLTIIERKDEPSRFYEEFVEEIRAKGKL